MRAMLAPLAGMHISSRSPSVPGVGMKEQNFGIGNGASPPVAPGNSVVVPMRSGGGGGVGTRSSRPAHSRTTRLRSTRMRWPGHSGPKRVVKSESPVSPSTSRCLKPGCA
jgi:hypothetical protein